MAADSSPHGNFGVDSNCDGNIGVAGNGVGIGGSIGKGALTIDDLRESITALGRSREEPKWLGEARREALETYSSLPLPDRVAHLWRYTEPDRFLPGGLLSDGAGGAVPGRAKGSAPQPRWPAEIRRVIDSGEAAGAAWSTGGSLVAVHLDPELARAGVVIEDLHRAARGREELLRKYLGRLLPASAGKFEALNAALWRGGILVHVPRGVEVKKPIHLLTSLGAVDGQSAALLAPRLLVIAGSSSAVTIVDEYGPSHEGPSHDGPTGGGSAAAPFTVCASVEVFGEESAAVRYVAVQRLGRGAAIHLSQRGNLERDARLISALASLGGLVSKADLGTVLAGRGAEVELSGFLFGEGRQHFDHHTVHDHQAPNTRSDLDFKVVLKDRSRSAYTGLIRIAPQAPNSEAYQENRNLLLNDGAKADSIPELEILTDEVMCTHGATMGSLDPEHVFYLRSRGIPRKEAARMVVAGFIEPTLKRLPEDLRERLQAYLDAELATI